MHTSRTEIIIREISKISEMRAVEDLQKEVWGVADLEVFPALALIPICDVGGVLIGAFNGRELAGFVFGFPGIEKGEPILHSDLLAVKSQYRFSGLGYKLKMAQRQSAISEGIKKISWTFDPLQSVNAHLNFFKLGVISDRYEINYYGETSSPLHRSGTDRLWVSWLLEGERVKQRLEADSTGQPAVTGSGRGATMLVDQDRDYEPLLNDQALSQELLAIKIPGELGSLTANNVQLFNRWREATRHAFTAAIKAGYVVEEFYSNRVNERREGCYLLRRETAGTR